jgi:uncharacterized protein (TIGR03435 family)
MKERELEEALTRGLTRHGEPSSEQVASDLARIRERLEVRGVRLQADTTRTAEPRSRWIPAAAAAALVLAGAIGAAIVLRPAEAALYRVVEGDVYQGETIRSNGGGGAVLALADGSRVEMRSRTELSLDRADDGVRIRLSNGGIIVNAAKQRTGHLYVQTKDMTVSVVGTVFVVNADADGSRVAVIEGEVRVQQGAAETKLRPGEAATTSPRAESFSVASELAWSRRADDLKALLQQTAVQQQPAPAALQASRLPRVGFEIVSIRSSGPAVTVPGARGGGGGANARPTKAGCVFDSFGYSYQIDPRRFAVVRTTLLHLAAYTVPFTAQGPGPRRHDLNCLQLTKVGLLQSAAAEWIKTDAWDVTAAIPEGTFASSPSLADPVLQQMIRTMLRERFGLVMRRETREVPVYLLKVGRDGPRFNGENPAAANRDPDRGPVFFTRDADGKRVRAGGPPPAEGGITVIGGLGFTARNVSIADWVNHLNGLDGRPVLDRTGLTERYTFYYSDSDRLRTGRLPAGQGDGNNVRVETTVPLPDEGAFNRNIVKAMGFELEESRAPFDVWVIDRAEKPAEN